MVKKRINKTQWIKDIIIYQLLQYFWNNCTNANPVIQPCFYSYWESQETCGQNSRNIHTINSELPLIKYLFSMKSKYFSPLIADAFFCLKYDAEVQYIEI